MIMVVGEFKGFAVSSWRPGIAVLSDAALYAMIYVYRLVSVIVLGVGVLLLGV
jgi:hypothetical protein